MQINEEIRGDVAVVTLGGALLDEEDGQELERKVASLATDNLTRIVFDAGKLHGINSQGLSALLRVVRSVRRKGGDIRIAGLDARLENLLAVTRLVRVFDTYETVGRALASYAR